MEQIKVNITKESRSGKYYATANGGKFQLCCFYQSDVSNIWQFEYLDRRQFIVAPDGGFPMEYFTHLCQSLWFLHFGVGELPEIKLTQATKRLLRVK